MAFIFALSRAISPRAIPTPYPWGKYGTSQIDTPLVDGSVPDDCRLKYNMIRTGGKLLTLEVNRLIFLVAFQNWVISRRTACSNRS